MKSTPSESGQDGFTRDYYGVLNVSHDATTEQIRAAYRFHLKAFHPDKFIGGTDHARNAQKRTEEIIEAYGVLSKPHFRAEYDRFRKFTSHAWQASPPDTVISHTKGYAVLLFRLWLAYARKLFFRKTVLAVVAALLITAITAWLVLATQNNARRLRDESTPPRSLSASLPTPVPSHLPSTIADASPSLPQPSPSETDIPTGSIFGVTEAVATQLHETDLETDISLRVGVKARADAQIDPAKARIQVFFYDLLDNKEVVLTNSDVSYEWLTPEHDWKKTPIETLTVQYKRQKKSSLNSNSPLIRDGKDRKYLGFIVRVYYDSQFQDERADPIRLRELFPVPTSDVAKQSLRSSAETEPLENGSDFATEAMRLRENAVRRVEPRVFVPTTSQSSITRFPWKTNIVTTTFWIGEKIKGEIRKRSVWDANWLNNYGGIDSPDPSTRRDYVPAAFVPAQNPFYCALPYNDVAGGKFKPEAADVIPWFRQAYTELGHSVCKDRWVAIRKGTRTCYAQWEDCGPFREDHFQYVFQNERPKPNVNRGAGLDVSPAVRDYLGLSAIDVTDWQFVEVRDVAPGPWRSYGDNNHFVIAKRQMERPSKPINDEREAARMSEFEDSRQTQLAWELEQKNDFRKAAELYRKPAENGNPYAQTSLAKLYMLGKGLMRDETKAKGLLEKAASQGGEEAQKLLDSFFPNRSGDDDSLTPGTLVAQRNQSSEPIRKSTSGAAGQALAISAPRPEYPVTARRAKITGSGVCVLTVDPASGIVLRAEMAQSTGSTILDKAATSAFRRWRFKSGTVSKIRMPITFTMSGAQY